MIEPSWSNQAAAPDQPVEAFPKADMSAVPLPPSPAPETAPLDPAPAETRSARPKPVVAFAPGEANFKTVRLDAPVIIDGAILTEVTVSRPTAALIREWSSVEAYDSNNLFEMMAGLQIGVLDQLFSDDANAITRAALGFLPRAMRPEKPSEET